MRLIDADTLIKNIKNTADLGGWIGAAVYHIKQVAIKYIDDAPSIDIVRCQDCKKSHIDGKTTHYLWCTEWGRSTDTFGYCERGEREGE